MTPAEIKRQQHLLAMRELEQRRGHHTNHQGGDEQQFAEALSVLKEQGLIE